MNQTRVKHTVTHGDIAACIGRLVLLNTRQQPTDIGQLCDHGNNGYCVISDEKHLGYAVAFGYEVIRSLVVSETERIELGDMFIDDAVQIRECFVDDKEYWSTRTDYRKILALPGQMSPETVRDIVYDRLTDGDDVYVECAAYRSPVEARNIDGDEFLIGLTDGHVRLSPVVKKEVVMYTREEMQRCFEAGRARGNEVALSTDGCVNPGFDDWIDDYIAPAGDGH